MRHDNTDEVRLIFRVKYVSTLWGDGTNIRVHFTGYSLTPLMDQGLDQGTIHHGFELLISQLPQSRLIPDVQGFSTFLPKKEEIAAGLFHCFHPHVSLCGSKRFQDANEGRTSDSGKPSRCALSRS